MAKRAKTAKKRSTRTTSRAAVSRYKAVSGRGVAGEAWDPSQPQAEAAFAIQEINEPRPYTSRYPIPEEQFRALKERAHRGEWAELRRNVQETQGAVGRN
jgi:hypothetical protein